MATKPTPTAAPALPKPMGRPTLPAALKTHPHTIYTTDVQWAKVKTRGLAWLRELIDKAD